MKSPFFGLASSDFFVFQNVYRVCLQIIHERDGIFFVYILVYLRVLL